MYGSKQIIYSETKIILSICLYLIKTSWLKINQGMILPQFFIINIKIHLNAN